LKVQGLPTGKLHGAEIDPRGDHRIAMAFAVAGLAAEGTPLFVDAIAPPFLPHVFSGIEPLAER